MLNNSLYAFIHLVATRLHQGWQHSNCYRACAPAAPRRSYVAVSRGVLLSAVATLASLLLAQPVKAAVVFNPEDRLAVGDETQVPSGTATCERTLTADVVAIDQVIFFNRLDVFLPSGMIYALRRDVTSIDGSAVPGPGNVQLRADKRPRPLVLRMNVGDCLEVSFTNLLAPVRVDPGQPATRTTSMMINGLSLVDSIASSGSHVGLNDSSLAAPGETRVYKWYASEEGAFLFHSAGALVGGEGDSGQPEHGLFGVVNVEPRGSVAYRSQVTAEELAFATTSVDANGNNMINYEAVYPAGHPFAGKPVLRILDGNEIFHSDLTAIISNIPEYTYPHVASSAPDNNQNQRYRHDPFREFTIIYHDEVSLAQSYNVLSTEFFAQSIADNMAINYGTGGIGAEIVSYGADEVVTGPFESPHVPAGNAALCNDCKYEESFLSSWAVGDPAMVFEREPVVNPCSPVQEAPHGAQELPGAPPAPGQEPVVPPVAACTPTVTGAAIRALYPEDPSNVYHSYLNDHVKMRVVHGAAREHHIHHLHAHQWLHSQNSDNSTYYDSQAIGPGSSFTLDIAYNGGGNRNKTVGDSIFHCHFYPHFAQGMWSLWRNHDVFEDGTRKLPDAELPEGTPIPAVVPLPGQAMAPPPSDVTPGYPFFIPGRAGHRPPHPPLDTVDDGGLPRHVVRGGSVLDGERGPFDRIALEMDAVMIPEDGSELEKEAMAFHAQRFHSSVTPQGEPATFITNGRPPVAGAPYADPCVDDDGNPVNIDAKRVIKAAVIQIDAIMNKAGWHFPQTRLFTLWGDVGATQDGTRPPEPFFIRAHSNDCIEYHLTNLLPSFYDADDFQVFTPTDIIGQHIHLVKFDVTSSDGSGNGWNYEDGSFAPDEVLERIEAINAMGGLDQGDGTRTLLAPRAHPYFGVLGAQTTIQRWWADPLLNAQGDDRTIRTVFTHDHFGPSTHQQAGLYAALLIEPSGSSWRNPETGEMMGNRFDGGPTSWHADILTADPADSHREFMIEFQDFALAYTADNQPVNPPGRTEAPLPFMIEPPLAPMPEAISTDDVGTFTVNYRNEPLALRIRDPLGTDYDGSNGVQALGRAGDLAYAYQSRTDRADPAFNVQPNYYGPLSADVGPGDPYTPMMRAYEGDNVQIRMIAGGAEEGHNWSMHGVKWLHEPDDPSSGFRNSQMAGISEHFEFELGRLPEVSADDYTADFLYKPGASVDDQWNGLWGLLREYEGLRNDLLPLPNNPDGRLPSQAEDFQFGRGVCPVGAPVREYQVSAVAAADALEGGTLMYNRGHGLHDPTALLYVATEDLYYGHLKPGAPIEPLILRASAGECIRVTLRNQLPAIPPDLSGYNLMPMVVNRFNANQIRPSAHVGLHPQLVHYDVRRDDGIQVGNNKNTTVGPGQERTYIWYAGDIEVLDDGTVVATPIEFGGVNLLPADLIKHSSKGLVGALVIEPQGSSWSFPNADSRATADVTYPGGSFREFVMVSQDDIQLRLPGGEPVKPAGGEVEDPEDSGNGGINYKSEPMWTRAGYDPNLDFLGINDLDLSGILSIADGGEIETPIFSAEVGTPVRFRVLRPQGHPRNNIISIHGHMWRHEPGNPESDFIGSQAGHGPSSHWDIIPMHGAGGAMGITGDYLYRDREAARFDGGSWGIFRVTEAGGTATTTTTTTTLPMSQCSQDSDCADDNPCTSDVCVNGECIATPVSDGTSCNDDDSCTSDDVCSSGSCVATTTQLPVSGDATADCRVNILDALVIVQHAVDLRTCSELAGFHLCDVHEDGACNIVDALYIARCTVGLFPGPDGVPHTADDCTFPTTTPLQCP